MSKQTPIRLSLVALLAGALLLPNPGLADPCGMVPPIQINSQGNQVQLQRTGAQRTWVMFDRGIETIALRPGFTGNAADFGMLIPFPSPPAIRKISDDLFAQLEGAIDPPTLDVRIYEHRPRIRARRSSGGPPEPSAEFSEAGPPLEEHQVRVLSEEAVGMYQVAVLEAGSPAALAAWMAEHGYSYPDGMDAVAKDYVDLRWCFVAVKARVAPESAVTAKPGMRSVNTALPAGASFDGFVQGMGFRFRTEEPVVPMRLSVFNGADPRNVVYVLATEPVRINGVPLSTVVRQVSGKQLYKNVTRPIPVTFEGGDEDDLSVTELKTLEQRRDPKQYNGIAADLFAAELMALRRGELALAVETAEKQVLNVSEALGLRGPEIDALHAEALAEARTAESKGALADLKKMHLTVLDGIFPGELLATQNLSFSEFAMGEAQNQPRQEPIRPAAGRMTVYK
jgi:hypothetical protein